MIRSARKPLVRAPAAIKEPALLRKLSAAGAQSTLSPVRKTLTNKENARAGPSSARRRMESVGEEGEEEEAEEQDGEDGSYQLLGQNAAKGYKPEGRERALANQKARIVSEMATKSVPSGLSPRRTIQTARETLLLARPIPVKDTLPNKTKSSSSIFELYGSTLSDALDQAQTRAGFHSSGEITAPSS